MARSPDAPRRRGRIPLAVALMLFLVSVPAPAAASLAALALPAVADFSAPHDVQLSSAALTALGARSLPPLATPILLRSFTRGADRVAELMVQLGSAADAAGFGRGFGQGAREHGARLASVPHAALWRGVQAGTTRNDAAVIEHGSVVAVLFAPDGALPQARLASLVAEQWQRLGGDPPASSTAYRIGRVVGYAVLPVLMLLLVVRRLRRH